MPDLLLDERAILNYLAAVADSGDPEPVSLRGMLGEDKADLPREEFDRNDWERLTDLYFAVRNLLMLGMVDGVAADGGEHLNRFRITDAGREVLWGPKPSGWITTDVVLSREEAETWRRKWEKRLRIQAVGERSDTDAAEPTEVP